MTHLYLLLRRLCCNREDRLTVDEIKRHPFFKGIDWDCLHDASVKGPFMPKIDYPEDTQHFEDYEPIDQENNDNNKRSTIVEVARPSARKVFSAKDIPFIGYTYKSFDAVNRLCDIPF